MKRLVTAVVGLQYGDEGKGRAVAQLVSDDAGGSTIVARANGGANAGHTVVAGGERYAFHQLPVGVFWGLECVLGAGMVIDPVELADEIAHWRDQGRDVRVHIDARAHVVTTRHKELDAKIENIRSEALGTTRRGNGPAYSDKMLRLGTRIGDFVSAEHVDEKRAAAAAVLEPLVCDTTTVLLNAFEDGRRVVIEGAHGVGLDIDHGDYPYVSSSSCTTSGLLASLGLPPQAVGEVVGVFKPYTTRVGTGPLVGEFHRLAERIRKIGHEYGTTTGRPRRVGALDLGQVYRYAMVCGVTSLFLAKADVVWWDLGTSGLPFRTPDGSWEKLPVHSNMLMEKVHEILPPHLEPFRIGYISHGPEVGQGVRFA